MAGRGCDFHIKDAKGRSSLHLAAARGRIDVLKYLWSKALDVEAEDVNGRTPLQLAAVNGHVDCVEFLLRKGAFPHTTDYVSLTPLHMAASRGHVDVLRVILDQEDSKMVLKANDLGLTPLGMAVMSGHTDCVTFLLDFDSEESSKECFYSPLHAACLSGRLSMVDLILKCCNRFNYANNPSKSTPLHCAAFSGNLDIVRKVLKVYSNEDALHYKDAHQNAPVSYVPSVCDNREEILKILEPKMDRAGKSQQDNDKQQKQPLKMTEELFASLNGSEQRRKVRYWSSLNLDDPSLLRSIGSFQNQDAIIKDLKKVKDLIRTLKVHEIYTHMHRDEQFQEDMRDSNVADTVELLRNDPSQYERYADTLKVGSVLRRMQVAHGELKGLGERNLVLDYALVKKAQSEVRAEDELKKKALVDRIEKMYEDIERLCRGHKIGLNDKEQMNVKETDTLSIPWKALLLRNIVISLIIGLVAYIIKQLNNSK